MGARLPDRPRRHGSRRLPRASRRHSASSALAGLHPDIGLSDRLLEEAHVKRLIAAAAQVIGVATSDKLGTVSAFAPITALTHLITDNAATEEQLAPFRGYPCDPGVIN